MFSTRILQHHTIIIEIINNVLQSVFYITKEHGIATLSSLTGYRLQSAVTNNIYFEALVNISGSILTVKEGQLKVDAEMDKSSAQTH